MKKTKITPGKRIQIFNLARKRLLADQQKVLNRVCHAFTEVERNLVQEIMHTHEDEWHSKYCFDAYADLSTEKQKSA